MWELMRMGLTSIPCIVVRNWEDRLTVTNCELLEIHDNWTTFY